MKKRTKVCRNFFATTVCCLFLLLASTGISECSSPDEDLDGWTAGDGDCDDHDPAVYPGAPERCDGIDSNCDNSPDPSFLWYLDNDRDGAGDPAQSVSSCTAPLGTVGNAEDCDDSNSAFSPAAHELCDLRDNDCDGAIDEHLPAYRFRDADGDGFGTETQIVCQDALGYVSVLGDCNDGQAGIHPGANDLAGDGVDQDCGGSTGPEPSLGYPGSKQTTLAQALSLAVEGTTLWIGPGTWPALELVVSTPLLSLRGSHRADLTLLTAQQKGRLLRLSGVSGVHLDGLTLKDGQVVGNGGALTAFNSDLRMTDCRLEQNQALYLDSSQELAGLGGAIYLDESSAEIHTSTFVSNLSNTTRFVTESGRTYVGGGGAIAALDGAIVLTGSELVGNQVVSTETSRGDAGYGSTLWSLDTPITMTESSIRESDGWSAINMFRSTLTLSNAEISDSVGGLFLADGILQVKSSSFRNLIWGGVMLSGTSGRIEDSLFENNQEATLIINFTPSGTLVVLARNLIQGTRSSAFQGVIDLDEGRAYLENNTILGNISRYGAIGGEACSLVLRNNILFRNFGYNLFEEPNYPCTIDAKYNTFYNPSGLNYNNGTLDSTNSLLDPGFIRYTPNHDSRDDDLHLLPSSPVKHAGDGSFLNPDGSLPEHGMFTQTFNASQYYTDEDQDALYDGWERLNGADYRQEDGSADPDGDGLTQQVELYTGTRGREQDSDGDGVSDGVEVSVGSAPLDWYERPDSAGEVTQVVARVPGDFSSIQQAIDAAWQTGAAEVSPEIWNAPLWISDRVMHLSGRSPEEPFTLDPAFEDVGIQVMWGGLGLSNAIIQRGVAMGVNVSSGIFLLSSTAALDHVLLTENEAGLYGGAIGADASELSMRETRLIQNFGEYAPAMYALKSVVSFDGLEIRDNISSGAGIAAVGDSTLSGKRLLVLNNQTVANSAGFSIGGSEVDISNALFMNNISGSIWGGGGLAITDSNATLRYVTMIGNSALDYSGGIRLWGTLNQRLTLENVILAYNTPGNLYSSDFLGGTTYPMPVLARYSVLYNPEGDANFNYLSTGSTYEVVEPGFQAYSNGLPQDPHLSITSVLINTGDPSQKDADGTRSDLGMFGGPEGGLWDADLDGLPGYFWPGQYSDAPATVDPTLFEANDLDALLP